MESIRLLVREAARKRMEIHSGGQLPVSLVDVPQGDARLVHGSWMSLILISGPALRITCRLHFQSAGLLKLMEQGLGVETADLDKAMDFSKEFCNLMAGYIKQELEARDIPVGISLPLVTRGFDELFYRRSKDETEDRWALTAGPALWIGTPSLQVFHPELLEKIDFGKASDEDDGEVDFL